MDALALLCNLHADGPSTLRRLRDHGFDQLESFEHLDAASTAGLLGCGTAAAERFLKEARLLAQRVDSDWIDRDESPGERDDEWLAHEGRPEAADTTDELDDELPAHCASKVGLAAGERYAANGFHAASREEPEEPEEDAVLEKAAEVEEPEDVHGEAIERVLGVWRQRDASEPAPSPDHVLTPSPRRGPEVVRTPLASAAIEGLGVGECDRLARAGVGTLEELVDSDALSLSRKCGLRYTVLLRLQFQARRARPKAAAAVDVGAESEAVAAPAQRPSAADSRYTAGASGAPPAAPRAPSREDGAAGPFA
jgi:hypothetical protein